MCSGVDEERRQAVAKRRGCIVDVELGKREVTFPIVHAAVGIGTLRVADDAVDRSTSTLVFLWRVKPTMRDEPMLLIKELNTGTLLVILASWSKTSTSRKSAPNRRHMSRMITAVSVKRVKTGCTLPDCRSTWSQFRVWITVGGTSATQSTPIIPTRRGPPCFALVHWHVWQKPRRTYSDTSTSWPTHKVTCPLCCVGSVTGSAPLNSFSPTFCYFSPTPPNFSPNPL